MAEKRIIDWGGIEREYRVGVKNLREIATEFGVSHVGIMKRATKEGWDRDLQAKIQAKADTIVARAEVRQEERQAARVNDAIVIEANAEAIARVRMSHRADIMRFKALVMQLLDECEAEAADPALFAELGEILRSPDERGQDKLNDAYQKAISLPQRIKGVKELAETLKTLVTLEREAWGLATYVEPVQQTTVYETREQQLEGARRLAFSLARAAATTTTSRPANG